MDDIRMKNILIQLLQEFDTYCTKHNLTYYVIAGTLLGAIRHKGIIPWDDDIDICMPRVDYNKLIKLYNEGAKFSSDSFFLQTSANDVGFNKTFAKLRNSNTTEIPLKDAAYNYNHGAFLDIFPLDAIPQDKRKFRKQIKIMIMLEGILHYQARIFSDINDYGLSGKKKHAYRVIAGLYHLHILTPSRLYNYYHKIAAQYENEPHNEIGITIVVHDSPRFIFPQKCFEDIIRLPFENITVNAPAGYDNILKNSYGNYMTPVKQMSEHGETIFEATVPYKLYIDEHKNDLWRLWTNKRDKTDPIKEIESKK